MTDFYIKTKDTIAGPFTGVEVREAALARIVLPDTGIGASPRGPWTRASEAGLFSLKKVPLPHPPDTHVPQYRLTGVSEAFQGPFKLRELIGFASRRMLPMDALIRSDVHTDWVPVTRIGILNACFHGELIPAGSDRVAASSCLKSRVDPQHDVERWKGKKSTKTTPARVAALQGEQEPSEEQMAATDHADRSQDVIVPASGDDQLCESDRCELSEGSEQPSLADYNQEWRINLRKGSSIKLPSINLKYVWPVLAIAAVACLGLLWGRPGMQRSDLVGDWIYIAPGQTGPAKPSFGISFREDGRCVIFNAQGESWSGDFDWVDLHIDPSGFQNLAPMTAEFADVDKNHRRDVIRPGDGYIKLKGSIAKEPPLLGNHRVRDCYLRREGNNLQIGYLSSVKWTRERKVMEAGWMVVTPKQSRSGQITELKPTEKINGAELLAIYGLPDEARPMYPFELPDRVISGTLDGLQLVRYGARKLVLSADGELQNASPPKTGLIGTAESAQNSLPEESASQDDS